MVRPGSVASLRLNLTGPEPGADPYGECSHCRTSAGGNCRADPTLRISIKWISSRPAPNDVIRTGGRRLGAVLLQGLREADHGRRRPLRHPDEDMGRSRAPSAGECENVLEEFGLLGLGSFTKGYWSRRIALRYPRPSCELTRRWEWWPSG
jgi:hypothetical protein